MTLFNNKRKDKIYKTKFSNILHKIWQVLIIVIIKNNKKKVVRKLTAKNRLFNLQIIASIIINCRKMFIKNKMIKLMLMEIIIDPLVTIKAAKNKINLKLIIIVSTNYWIGKK